jgi:hypothetical protein
MMNFNKTLQNFLVNITYAAIIVWCLSMQIVEKKFWRNEVIELEFVSFLFFPRQFTISCCVVPSRLEDETTLLKKSSSCH